MPQHEWTLKIFFYRKYHSKKAAYFIIPFACNVQDRQIYGDRKNSYCLGLGLWRKLVWIANEYIVSVWGGRNVLTLSVLLVS